MRTQSTYPHRNAFNRMKPGRLWLALNQTFGFLIGIVVLAASLVALECGFASTRGELEADRRPISTSNRRDVEESPGATICHLAFSPDGRFLALGTIAGSVTLKHLATDRTQTLQRGPIGSIRPLLFSPVGRALIFAGRDSTVRLWDWETGAVTEFPQACDPGRIRCVAVSHDGTTMAVGTDLGVIRLSPLHSQQNASRQLDPSASRQLDPSNRVDAINQVVISPDRQWLAAGDVGGWLRIWELATGRLIRSVRVAESPIISLAFAHEGSQLLTLVSLGRTVQRWGVADGRLLGTVANLQSTALDFAVSSDSSLIVVARTDGVAELLETTSGQTIGTVELGRGPTTVVFSPDGQRFATGGHDGGIRVWNVQRVRDAFKR